MEVISQGFPSGLSAAQLCSLMPTQTPASSRKVSLDAQPFSAPCPQLSSTAVAGPHILLLFSLQRLQVAQPQQVLVNNSEGEFDLG